MPDLSSKYLLLHCLFNIKFNLKPLHLPLHFSNKLLQKLHFAHLSMQSSFFQKKGEKEQQQGETMSNEKNH